MDPRTAHRPQSPTRRPSGAAGPRLQASESVVTWRWCSATTKSLLAAAFRRSTDSRKCWVCLGAMAWFTDFEVLDAMTSRYPPACWCRKKTILRPAGRQSGRGQEPHGVDGWRDMLREHVPGHRGLGHPPDPAVLRPAALSPAPSGDMDLTGDQIHRRGQVLWRQERETRGKDARRPAPDAPQVHSLRQVELLSQNPVTRGRMNPAAGVPHWDPRIVWTGSCNCTRLTPAVPGERGHHPGCEHRLCLPSRVGRDNGPERAPRLGLGVGRPRVAPRLLTLRRHERRPQAGSVPPAGVPTPTMPTPYYRGGALWRDCAGTDPTSG